MDKISPKDDQRITSSATRFAMSLTVSDYTPIALAAYAYIEGATSELQRAEHLLKKIEKIHDLIHQAACAIADGDLEKAKNLHREIDKLAHSAFE